MKCDTQTDEKHTLLGGLSCSTTSMRPLELANHMPRTPQGQTDVKVEIVMQII